VLVNAAFSQWVAPREQVWRRDAHCDYVSTARPAWRSALRWALSALPEGGALPAKDFAQRHRAILVILRCHVLGIFAFGLYQGFGFEHAFMDTLPVVFAAVLASGATGRRMQSAAASLGLLLASAVIVHLRVVRSRPTSISSS